MTEGYRISREFAERTVKAIKRLDDMSLGGGNTLVQTRFEDDGGFAQKLKRGTFTGSWSIGESKAVTLVADTSQTVAVTNYCVNVSASPSSATLNVIFGSASGTASAVEVQSSGATAEITVLTGVTLTTSGLQFTRMKAVVMSTATASSVSIGVTACAT